MSSLKLPWTKVVSLLCTCFAISALYRWVPVSGANKAVIMCPLSDCVNGSTFQQFKHMTNNIVDDITQLLLVCSIMQLSKRYPQIEYR